MSLSKKIGQYDGHVRGPLVLVLGAMHGNEPSGVAAIQQVFQRLEAEPKQNPGFVFSGRMVGYVGNSTAYHQGQRFVQYDMNRRFGADFVAQLLQSDCSQLQDEDLEIYDLLTSIKAEITAYQPTDIVVFDLHSTSADGGIFSIPLESDPNSVQLAAALHAPVVKGLLKGLDGTFIHYVNHPDSVFGASGARVSTAAFESGQHDDPLSVDRAVSATISLLRAAGCVREEDVHFQHDEILQQYAAELPKVTRIVSVHSIQPDEQFVMRPGYRNFQQVMQGEYLADNQYGPILADQDGFILMPLYQSKGNDGFFLVVEE